MDLHEYQGKALLRENGITVPDGVAVGNLSDAVKAYKVLESERVVIKAQVHAGGRGKAGGVKIVSNQGELENEVKNLLGSNLVTHQTDKNGLPIHQVLIETPSNIVKEYYLSILVDRTSQMIKIVASSEGGMDIEAVAESNPEKIIQIDVDPTLGLQPFQSRELGFAIGLKPVHIKQFTLMLSKLYKLFCDNDLSLVEINPLITNDKEEVICLDSKISVDENALYRQKALASYRDPSQEDERENHAKQWDLNYVHLDGNIGCMVNGAGLAMATMDIIKVCGGLPANFLDVGGGATEERVTEGFKIILSDKNVRGIFVNIFGGIVKCDLIADGIINACQQCNLDIPVVVRLVGNNAELGAKKLNDSGLNLIGVDDLLEASKCIVQKVEELA
ncbi:MAG: ADP-forming succinate--CoA ligase subunit beta [Legionellales bacterium]|nr:ADP-forming succinate--CoA ligase subunit beta [Legionellales bacterium]OUX64730.1 MAG: succinate--CoA ligase subunit beta [Gammaproteobacteria bacterium TMED281]